MCILVWKIKTLDWNLSILIEIKFYWICHRNMTWDKDEATTTLYPRHDCANIYILWVRKGLKKLLNIEKVQTMTVFIFIKLVFNQAFSCTMRYETELARDLKNNVLFLLCFWIKCGGVLILFLLNCGENVR